MTTIQITTLILNALELAACIVGFINWKKIRDSYWKWFPFYLLLIVLTELVAEYTSYILKSRHWNINIYHYFGIPLQFFFFFWLFGKYLRPFREKYWPIWGMLIYVLCWMIDHFYLSAQRLWFMSFSYTVGNILLLVLIILFFYKLMNSDQILRYRSNMMFWICLGMLLFYLCTFPFYALRNTIFYDYHQLFYPYFYISFVLNYLMYAFFILAFLWGKPK